jgi:uncharacterized delta-60 repeat protein
MKKQILTFVLFSIFIYSIAQTPGSPDLTFGGTGIVSTDMNTSNDYGYYVLIQNDGKIIIIGSISIGSDYYFGLARFNINGTIDTSFSSDGKVITPFGGLFAMAYSGALQSNGKIIAVGETGSSAQHVVVRYLTNGTLDNTFGTGGKYIGGGGQLFSTAVQSDKKIIGAGQSGMNFSLLRLDTTGILDNTFGTSGEVITNFPGAYTGIQSIVLQPDQKIVASGAYYDFTYNKFALARYNTNGTLDTTFGTDGKVVTAVGNSLDRANALAIQNDGKILVTGSSRYSTYDQFATIRYNSNGTIDNSFGTNGIVKTRITNNDQAYAIILQNDGKILVTGYATDTNTFVDYAFVTVRYNTNGTLDNSFGSSGKVLTMIGNSGNNARSIALQSDGKIIVAGNSNYGTNVDFTAVRYYNNPLLINESVINNDLISVYPNPANEKIILEFIPHDVLQDYNIIVLNIQGQLLLQQHMQQDKTEINISSLDKGVYIVRVLGANLNVTKKIIKQ